MDLDRLVSSMLEQWAPDLDTLVADALGGYGIGVSRITATDDGSVQIVRIPPEDFLAPDDQQL